LLQNRTFLFTPDTIFLPRALCRKDLNDYSAADCKTQPLGKRALPARFNSSNRLGSPDDNAAQQCVPDLSQRSISFAGLWEGQRRPSSLDGHRTHSMRNTRERRYNVSRGPPDQGDAASLRQGTLLQASNFQCSTRQVESLGSRQHLAHRPCRLITELSPKLRNRLAQAFFWYLHAWLILLVIDRDFRHHDLNNARLSATTSPSHGSATRLKVVP